MKISSKTDYALKTILDLAMHRKQGVVRIADIAERQDIPPKFLEQILLVLKGAGIVESRRGASGGYLLSTSPSKLTLASVVRLTEDGLCSVHRARESANSKNTTGADIAFHEVWVDIGQYISKKLEKITIQDMCNRAKEVSEKRPLEYEI